MQYQLFDGFFFDEFVLILCHLGIWKTFMMCSVDLLHSFIAIHGYLAHVNFYRNH